MAEIINDPSDSDDNHEEQVEQQSQQPPKQEPPKDDLPEKYRGKSPAEIARMHSELEHVVGRQGHELGELRRLIDDEYLRPRAKGKPDGQADSKPTESTDDDTELFVNPKKYLEKAIAEHPLLKELKNTTAKSQAERNQEAFQKKHPDASAILREPEFREFVQKSKYRSELFLKAHRDYDADAGDELFSLYKEIRKAKAPEQEQGEQKQDAGADKAAADAAREAAVRAGKVPSGNANPTGDGGKKIYRRADLMRMRREDPERYDAMGDEILAAYAEGRVR